MFGFLVLSDIAMLACAFLMAYWIRFDLQFTVAPEVTPSVGFYTRVGLTLVSSWVGLFGLYGLYSPSNLLGGAGEYSRVFNASTVGMMLVVLGSFLEPTFVVARGWLVLAWLLALLMVCTARFAFRRLVYAAWRNGRLKSPALVVGMNGEAVSLATQLDQDVSSGFQVLGIVSPGKDLIRTESSSNCQFPWLGSIEDIPSLVQVLRVREVIVAASSVSREDLLRLFERLQPLNDVTLRLSTGLYEVLTTGIQVRNVASIPLVELGRLRLSGTQLAAKTVFEYLSTLLVLVLSLPLFIIVALLVKFASPGPLIYRRRVVGVGGKEFDAFKFRTMSVNGDQVLAKHPGLHDQLNRDGKLKDDPRVTKVGRFLRRYSLDELPQLLNVLRGEMSLVGPRMITSQEAQQYGPHKLSLLTVKPGITGLWQVSGRSELSYADRVRLDIHYIRNYSLWMDLQILLVQTPSAVLRGRGAY